MNELTERAGGACELCGSESDLEAVSVDVGGPEDLASSVLACGVCGPEIESGAPLEGAHWYCLQEAVWSAVPAVQVVAYRMLHRVQGQSWATDVLSQVYLEDEVNEWAQRGLTEAPESTMRVVDSNGSELEDGDSVTLIKDLDVKGAGFTAKRGTMVKNIRLGDDPTHIEGRVNKVSVMLKTCFLKRST